MIDGFEPTLAGQLWAQFYGDNIGQFLRNAAIYNYPDGMVQFYKDQEVIPVSSVDTGSPTTFAYQLRLTPSSTADNVIGASNNPNDLPVNNVEIYGWLDIPPSTTEPYWLLVKDTRNRLVWVASGAIQHNSTTVTTSPEINPELIAPDRPYANSDLNTITGDGG